MEQQGTLFPPGTDAYGATPSARKSDPISSHEAAKKHTDTGKRAKHAEIVLGIVKRHPGSTYAELFDFATSTEKEELTDKYEVMRRLNDLAKALPAAVVKGEMRRCAVQGSPMTTWAPTGN